MNTISKGHIYVAAHEVLELPHNDLYRPILVGASNLSPEEEIPKYYLRDDTGENISDHNNCLSELTGLYWIWKNRDDDWMGLAHYRRFFVCRRSAATYFRRGRADDLVTKKQLSILMRNYDLILPGKRYYLIETLYSHYCHTFDGRHLDSVREIIKDLCPDYLYAFDCVMRMRSGYMFNMMIMKKDMLDNYCSWLFPILFELEKREMRPDLDPYQKRFGGRVGERLFNVWLYHQIRTGYVDKNKIRALPVLRTDTVHWVRKISAFLMARFFHRPYARSW